MDPEQLAIAYVQQFLHERGFRGALKALEDESGLLYDDLKLQRGGQLMQLVWQQMESSLAELDPEEASLAEEDEAMLNEGNDDYPQTVISSIEGVHPANILCVKLLPGCEEVLTGSGDGCVRRVCFGGSASAATAAWTTSLGGGGVLCMDLHPHHTQHLSTASVQEDNPTDLQPPLETQLLAVGSMDGHISLIQTSNGCCIARSHSHSKYAGGVAWAGDGQHVVSCSHDRSVVVHCYHQQQEQGQHQEPSDHHHHQQQQQQQQQDKVMLSIVRQVEFTSVVQHVAALHDSKSVIIAVRDSHCLRVLDASGKEPEIHEINLNAAGDNHVSFFACHIAVSPCGRLLLVSTNKGRLLVLRQKGINAHSWCHCPALGHMQLAVEQFHTFSAAWHRDSRHVLAAAAGAEVWVFHVGTGKVKAKLDWHKVNVRNLDFNGERLATCSFDKTVKIVK